MTQLDYDAELRAYNVRLRAETHIRPGDRVLDIGCGTGQSTREAARLATPGRVLGIDVSAGMLERARALTAAAHLDNVTYQLGDAQLHPFAPASYDLVISRFGTMFFTDAVAAFTNIAHAMRPGARLVMLVWQSRDRNEWATALDSAMLGRVSASPTEGAFSLGDRPSTETMLSRAGFHSIDFTDVREPMFFGRGTAAALEHVRAFKTISDALEGLSSADAASALERLRATLVSHYDDDVGVVFDSRAWLVTARRTAR